MLTGLPGVVPGANESVRTKVVCVVVPSVLNWSWDVPLMVWKTPGVIPPDCLAMTKDPIPVAKLAAPNAMLRVLAPAYPMRPPMIPPRPKSTLGDTDALKTKVEAKASLMTAVVVLTKPVVIVEADTVEVVTDPAGAFSVEKLPTPAVIVPEEMLEMFSVDMLAKPAYRVEAAKELRFKTLPRAKLDTFRVDAVIELVRIEEMFAADTFAIVALTVLAFSVLTLSGSVNVPVPVDTNIVENTAMLARMVLVSS